MVLRSEADDVAESFCRNHMVPRSEVTSCFMVDSSDAGDVAGFIFQNHMVIRSEVMSHFMVIHRMQVTSRRVLFIIILSFVLR